MPAAARNVGSMSMWWTTSFETEPAGMTPGQRISAGTALLIGVGGIGCATASYLASSGVGRLALCDFDTVDVTNLGRQMLYGPEDIGKPKAQQAAERLARINPEIDIVPVTGRLDGAALRAAIAAADVVVDPLVMPIGAMATAGQQVFTLVRRLREELGVNTTCGASNVSFGLPNRHGINAAFLPMAIASGMTSAIMNPVRPQEMEAIRAANFLMNQKREHVAQIEMRYGLSVRVEGDPSLISPEFSMSSRLITVIGRGPS